jgi:hypothetical protein
MSEEDKQKAVEMPKSDVGIIESGIAELERNIRELHDRLVPVMRPPDATAEEDGSERPSRSPVAERISLIHELINDIHDRLEL